MGGAPADTAEHPRDQGDERSIALPAFNFSLRLILPAIGAATFLLAYVAQNVWGIFHVETITSAIRTLDRPWVVVTMFALGLIEGTVVVCLYVPGTAVIIVLLLGLQPSLGEALPLAGGLLAGTVAGYAISTYLGRLLNRRLPRLVGEAYFRRVQSLIDRYGVVAFIVGALHPNQLALTFAISGYFRAERVWRYLAVAVIAQGAWWSLYGLLAEFIAAQNVVSSSNFQLYVAGLFLIWLAYELLSPRRPQDVS